MIGLIARLAGGVKGFSVTETATMMTALSLLTATAAPNIQQYVALAQVTKATGDVRVIVVSLVRLMNDVGQLGSAADGIRPDVLVGPGRAPEAASSDASDWSRPVDGSRVRPLADYLLTDAAGYGQGRWRGPYLDGLSEDPWGCRYAINVGPLLNWEGRVTVALSSGPDCVVETPFRMIGLSMSGDDIVGLISSGR